MATVWLAPKKEYNGSISEIDPRWVWETVREVERDESLSLLANMVWIFQKIVSGQLSNLYNVSAFQADLYENIDPKNSRAIIAATHHPNCAMHKISISVNRLPMHF